MPCIGDRLLTDVVFANRYGMQSVLVAPLSYTRDHPVAVVLRYVRAAAAELSNG
jgi:predicted HAD superfamily phosphohydrolase YqeG